jgi:hypothetical protein
MQDHYLPHQYNLSNLIYDTPEIDELRRTIRIFDNKKGKPLYIQTPELINIFGVIKKKNYSEILLPLGGIHAIVFKNFINQLENKILRDANINKSNWFNSTKTKSVKFIPVIKELNEEVTSTMEQTEHLDKCHDGVIKIKVTSNTMIRKDSNDIGIEELVKNNKLRIILQIYAIWVTMVPLDEDKTSFASSFGIYLKPEIIEERVCYNLNFIEEEKIIFESDSEDESESEKEEEEEKE